MTLYFPHFGVYNSQLEFKPLGFRQGPGGLPISLKSTQAQEGIRRVFVIVDYLGCPRIQSTRRMCFKSLKAATVTQASSSDLAPRL